MCQIAHSIREQVMKHQRQAMGSGQGRYQMDDLSKIKKSTRSLLESSTSFTNINIKQEQASVVIDENNYLRDTGTFYGDLNDNLSLWEPRVELLDPNDIRKVQKTEDRKIRFVPFILCELILSYHRYEKRKIR